jgi:OmpA-OmpF porin, OOP family
MNIIDPLLKEATERFSLGNGASPLFSSLLSLIVNPQNGGIAGFFSRFQQAGLGNLVSSWMGHGDNNPISANQLEQVLGGETVGRLAASAGLPAATAAPAMAFMLPKIIDHLTPDGAIPSAIPAWAGAFLPAGLAGLAASTIGGFTERDTDRSLTANYPDPGVEVSRRSGAAVIDRSPVAPVRTEGGAWWKWLLPLVLLGLLGWLFSQFLGRKPVEQTTVAPTVTTPAVTGSSTATGSSTVTGSPAVTGSSTVTGSPTVAGSSAATGSSTVTGSPAGSSAATGSPAVTGSPAATESSTATETLKSFNLSNINFETGSANIIADSLNVMDKNAEAIKAMPAGTKIEIGGHTDNTGDPNFNTTLSQDRANAVKDELVKLGVNADMLTTKGYGSTKAIADNSTSEGKLKNRRIEFVVTP